MTLFLQKLSPRRDKISFVQKNVFLVQEKILRRRFFSGKQITVWRIEKLHGSTQPSKLRNFLGYDLLVRMTLDDPPLARRHPSERNVYQHLADLVQGQTSLQHQVSNLVRRIAAFENAAVVLGATSPARSATQSPSF